MNNYNGKFKNTMGKVYKILQGKEQTIGNMKKKMEE